MTVVVDSGPNWADIAIVVVTAIGVVAGFVTLVLALREFRRQTGELHRQTGLASAQRALELMRMLADLGSVFVERPDLDAYFGTKDSPPPGSTLEIRVLAHANGYMNLAETTGWQIAVEQMTREAAQSWHRYFSDLYETTPALVSVVRDRKQLLAKETIWLLEGGNPPSSVERLPSMTTLRGCRRDWAELFLLGGFWLLFFGLLIPAALAAYLIGNA